MPDLPKELQRFVGVVAVDTAFLGAPDQNVGASKEIDVGQSVTILEARGKDNAAASLHTLSATWSYQNVNDARPTDDLSGLYFLVRYGLGGTAEDDVEVDPIVGRLLTAPLTSVRLIAKYNAPVPTPENPTPTTPKLMLRGMIAQGSRPSSASAPTRTRLLTLPANGTSPVALVPRMATTLNVLGSLGPYSATFFSDRFGTSPLVTVAPIVPGASSGVNVPLGAQSFAITTAGAAERIQAVFELTL